MGLLTNYYTRLGSTINHSATTDVHNSQITTAIAKYFPACFFASRSLVMTSNSGDPIASRAQMISS
jgi:hypothetical protein